MCQQHHVMRLDGCHTGNGTAAQQDGLSRVPWHAPACNESDTIVMLQVAQVMGAQDVVGVSWLQLAKVCRASGEPCC